jgi:hypothetical protein
MVAHAYNPSTWMVEVGTLEIRDQLALHSEF